MKAKGGTNISEAMALGMTTLLDQSDEERNNIQSVLLFTDGRTGKNIKSSEGMLLLCDDPSPENHHVLAKSDGKRARDEQERMMVTRFSDRSTSSSTGTSNSTSSNSEAMPEDAIILDIEDDADDGKSKPRGKGNSSAASLSVIFRENTGKTHSLTVAGNRTIRSALRQIRVELPTFSAVTLDGKNLDIDSSFDDNNIPNESILLLAPSVKKALEAQQVNQTYQIYIRMASGRSFPITVNGTDTVGALKMNIEAEFEYPGRNQQLFFDSKHLQDDDAVLNDIGIKKESLVTLIIQQKRCKHDIMINTFGIGHDHNDDVLKDVSEYTGGQYYFIEDSKSIPVIFGDCIGGLMSTVSKDMKIIFTAQNDARIVQSIDSRFDNAENTGDGFIITLSDIQSEEARDILLELEIPKLVDPNPEPTTYMNVTAQYKNLVTGEDCSISTDLNLTRHIPEESNDGLEPTPEELIWDQKIKVEQQRIQSLEVMQHAVRLARLGRNSDAVEMVSKYQQESEGLVKTISGSGTDILSSSSSSSGKEKKRKKIKRRIKKTHRDLPKVTEPIQHIFAPPTPSIVSKDKMDDLQLDFETMDLGESLQFGQIKQEQKYEEQYEKELEDEYEEYDEYEYEEEEDDDDERAFHFHGANQVNQALQNTIDLLSQSNYADVGAKKLNSMMMETKYQRSAGASTAVPMSAARVAMQQNFQS
eukprot:TRINITY_DN2290_c2_g3_i4.p1 TRINITY_DN2290_c2_g3~~TRINITY_DN2290_c2_g3_i4.p1  ORF type:complete len:701 (+),score=282.67 TRINITY_DN2290_c2_g3_i4:238-2340(+)